MRRRGSVLTGLRCATVMILLLLVSSPFITGAQAQTGSVASQYADHGLATLAESDRVTLSVLDSMTNGNTSVSAFERVIQDAYIPLGVREVLLDIGWENFTVGNPPYQAWVSNWLTASDAMGLSNVLYVGQLTAQGFDSPWVESLISVDPSAATYYANGTSAPFVSLDNPEVAHYLEVDLGILYSYYGSYSSWVGLGTGSSQSSPYYATGDSVPTIGYSNLSVSAFVNSPYYDADVNATGYLASGQLDALWSEYRDVQPGIVLSSGVWMTSSAYDVYGSGTQSSFVEMRFEIPANTTTLQIQWYGSEVGAPGNLQVEIFGDKEGTLNSGEELASLNSTASDFTNSTGWQGGVKATGNFSAGWYWVKFSSPSSDQSNYYTFYLRDYVTDNATAYAAQAAVGPGLEQGSTILWLENQAGANLAIYPYQEAYVGAPAQTFTATHVFSFNTVFVFLSDRQYNTANATLTVTDVTDGNRVVATGLLSQALDEGLQNWVPIALNGTVTTVTGDEYTLTVDDPSFTWVPIMRYVVTSPPQAGFQNQNQTLLFELGDLDWSQGFTGYAEFTALAQSPTTGTMDAVGFTPSTDETMESVQVLMYSTQGGASSNYTSGTFSVAIWGSNAAGSAPEYPLQQLEVPATSVPYDGFLNVSGFSTQVTAGKEYWIVFSANSTGTFNLARLTSTYQFLTEVSDDGGSSWLDQPGDGPTELAFTVTLSNETLGTYIAGETDTTLTSGSIFAQPFVASSDSSVEGVDIGPLVGEGPYILVSIVPSGSDGEPLALSPLASGVYDPGNITIDYGPEFVQFSSVAHLQQGEKYWITIQPIGGSYDVTSFLYLKSDPDLPVNASAAVSVDDGFSWTTIGNSTTSISTIPDYLLETATTAPPQYDTQEIVSDLTTNHDFSVSSGPLKGWNAYIQASELETFNGVAQWLSNLAGRGFEFYTNAQTNVLSQLNLNDIAVLPAANATSTCAGLLSGEDSAIVSGGDQFTYASMPMLEQCSSEGVESLAQELNYLPYLGGNFGLSTANSVLVVGDQPSLNLTSYLSNAFDVTYVNFISDPGLQSPANLSSFKAIVWLASGNETISSSVSGLLARYVRQGGELVTSDASLASLAAFAPGASVTGSQAASLNSSSFLQTALVHTEYANDTFQETASGTTLTARSADLNITAAIIGAGKFVFVSFANSALPQPGDQSVVISNLVSDDANVSAPLWYPAGDAQAASTDEYSVDGAYGGHLLVLVYNPSAVPSTFSLDLNGSYYDVPSSWKTVEIPSLNVTVGAGSDVEIGATIPPQTLVGIVVVPASNPLIGYSSASVQAQYTYPDQSLYSVAAKVNQSVLVMISTNDSASQILLNDLTSIPQTTSISQLDNASTGWYFDAGADSLFIKYQSTGTDALRFVFYSPPVPPTTSFPLPDLLAIFAVAIAAELIAAASILSRQPKEEPKGPGPDSPDAKG